MALELAPGSDAGLRWRGRVRVALVTAAAIAAQTAAFGALSGCRRELHLPFFPSLSSCASGFVDEASLEREGVLLSRLQAQVRLPLLLAGAGTLELHLSSPAGPRRVQLAVGEEHAGQALVDGPTPAPYSFHLADGLRPLDLSLTVQPLNERLRGVRAHDLTLIAQGGRLIPTPAVLAALAAGLLGLTLVLVWLGLAWRKAVAAIILLAGLPVCLFAAVDPFAAALVVGRLYLWVPLVVAAALGSLAGLGRLWPAAALPAADRRWLALLLVAACLGKGGWVFHPRHFHADARIHNTVSRLALERGLVDLWRHIDQYQSETDLGLTRVPGGLTAVRYPPTFYSLAHLLDRAAGAVTGQHDVDYWNRLVAITASALGVVPVFLISRRWLGGSGGAAAVCCLIEVLSPVDLHELAGLSYSAILGKLVDLTLLCYVFSSGPRLRIPVLTALLLACLLTYPAALVTFGAQVGLVVLWLAAGRDWRPALSVALSAALALALAHAAFYGHLALDLLTHPGSAGMSWASRLAALANPRRWFWDEMGVYFTGLHLAAAAWAIVRVWRGLADRLKRAWLAGWSLASIGLLALQSLTPMLSFYRGAFLFSSLICIGCGVAVVSLWRRERPPWRLAALALAAFLLAAQGAKILGMIPAFFQTYDAHIPGPWFF